MNTYTFRFWQGEKWNIIKVRAESLTDAQREMASIKGPWELVSWGY